MVKRNSLQLFINNKKIPRYLAYTDVTAGIARNDRLFVSLKGEGWAKRNEESLF